MNETLKIITATAERYIKLDLKYKFQFILDSIIIAMNFLGFGIMGFFMQARGDVLPEEYTFERFILVGTYMWTILTKIYDDCTKVLQEEANRGTLTLLLGSNITTPIMLSGRALASTIKYVMLASMFGVPTLYFVGALNLKLEHIPLAILCFICSWLFIIGLSAILTAFIMIFKRIGMLTVSIMETLMFAIGFYFPIEILPRELWPILGVIPFTIGLQIFRDILILGRTRPMIKGVYSSLQIGIIKMVLGAIIFLAIAFLIMMQITRLAQKWGTIEQY